MKRFLSSSLNMNVWMLNDMIMMYNDNESVNDIKRKKENENKTKQQKKTLFIT